MSQARAGAAPRVAVVGAGWSGLAAAVEATQRGAQVTVFEMGQRAGGRASSSLHQKSLWLDNGQHILIGAYRDTLRLMAQVGLNERDGLVRLPLCLAYPSGDGLKLPRGPALPAFLWAVLNWQGMPWSARWSLLRMATGWQLKGFRCAPSLTVAQLCQSAHPRIWQDLIEPLCVAALNTPADQASAQVLLTVLKDALFGPAGSADLLLPKLPLAQLLPEPALRWLQSKGAMVHTGRRVQQLTAAPGQDAGWLIDGEAFDQVVLACSAAEAARLTAGIHSAWSGRAAAMRYQPIITVWLRGPTSGWPQAMMALRAGDDAPAQFGFDLAQLGGEAGLYALVVSGAASWVDQGAQATAEAVQRQMAAAFVNDPAWATGCTEVLAVRTEKRATFACTPGLDRPGMLISAGLVAAGDYLAGPYPATLEGAVRSGLAAARSL